MSCWLMNSAGGTTQASSDSDGMTSGERGHSSPHIVIVVCEGSAPSIGIVSVFIPAKLPELSDGVPGTNVKSKVTYLPVIAVPDPSIVIPGMTVPTK